MGCIPSQNTQSSDKNKQKDILPDLFKANDDGDDDQNKHDKYYNNNNQLSQNNSQWNQNQIGARSTCSRSKKKRNTQSTDQDDFQNNKQFNGKRANQQQSINFSKQIKFQQGNGRPNQSWIGAGDLSSRDDINLKYQNTEEFQDQISSVLPLSLAVAGGKGGVRGGGGGGGGLNQTNLAPGGDTIMSQMGSFIEQLGRQSQNQKIQQQE